MSCGMIGSRIQGMNVYISQLYAPFLPCVYYRRQFIDYFWGRCYHFEKSLWTSTNSIGGHEGGKSILTELPVQATRAITDHGRET